MGYGNISTVEKTVGHEGRKFERFMNTAGFLTILTTWGSHFAPKDSESLSQSVEQITSEAVTGKWLNIGLAGGALVLILLFRNVLAKGILYALLSAYRKKEPAKAEEVRDTMRRPFGWFLFFLIGALVLPLFALPSGAEQFFLKVLNSALVIAAARMLYLGCRQALKKVETRADILQNTGGKTALGYLGGALQFVIILLGVILVLNQWVTNLSGVFATLGITGVALALAAQDTASNFIAGLAIMLDKPFDIGDWISTNASSGKIEGTVTAIGLRSSRVRAIDGSLLTVPNSLMGSAVIVNGTKRVRRLVNLNLLLEPDAPADRLALFRQRVLEILEKDPDIIAKTGAMNFTGFERGALAWNLRFETNEDYSVNVEAANRVNLAVVRLAAEMEIALARGFAAKA